MEDGSIQYAEFVVEGVLMLVVSCFGVILNIIRYVHTQQQSVKHAENIRLR